MKFIQRDGGNFITIKFELSSGIVKIVDSFWSVCHSLFFLFCLCLGNLLSICLLSWGHAILYETLGPSVGPRWTSRKVWKRAFMILQLWLSVCVWVSIGRARVRMGVVCPCPPVLLLLSQLCYLLTSGCKRRQNLIFSLKKKYYIHLSW